MELHVRARPYPLSVALLATTAFLAPLAAIPSCNSPAALGRWALIMLLPPAVAAVGLWEARKHGSAMGLSRAHILVPLGTLVVWAALSSGAALSPHSALFGHYGRFYGLTTQAALAALAIEAALLVRGKRELDDILAWFIAGGCLAALLGVLQYLGITPAMHSTDPSRAASTFGSAAAFASYLSLFLPIAATIALLKDQPGWRRVLAASAAAAAALALLLTSARAAWGAIGVAMVVLALANRRSAAIRWRYALIPTLVAVTAALGVMAYRPAAVSPLQRIAGATRGEESLSTRMLTWVAATRAVRIRPLVGTGPDSFYTMFPSVRPAGWAKVSLGAQYADKAHNDLLETAATLGLPGLVAALWLLVLIAWGIVRQLARTPSGAGRVLLAGLGSGLLAYFLQLQAGLSWVESAAPAWLVLGICARMSLGVPDKERPTPGAARPSASGPWWPVWFALSLAALGLALFGVPRTVAADIHMANSVQAVRRGDFAQATDEAQAAAAKDHAQPEYLVQLGKALMERTKSGLPDPGPDAAVEALTQATLADPYDAVAYFWLVKALALSGATRGGPRVDSIPDVIKSWLAFDPRSPTAYFLLGNYSEAAGDTKSAIASYRRSLRVWPGYPDSEAALRRLRRSRDSEPDP